MKKIFAVAVKEIQIFFYSPLLYVLWALFFFFNSWAFVQILEVLNNPVGAVQIAPVEIFFGGTIFFWLLTIVLVPLITMRTISEEKRVGSLEEVLTAPISEWEFLLGKFIAVNFVLMILWLSSLIYPLLIAKEISFHWPAVGIALLGVGLLNGVFSSIGIFASSLTANQIVSGFLSFVMIVILFTVGVFSRFVVGFAQKVLSYLSVLDQFQGSFSSGILDSRAVVYFLSLSVLFLALTWVMLVRGKRQRLSAWISVILLSTILVGGNVLSFMHWREWDFSGQTFYHLSDRGKDLLKTVNKDVNIFVCLVPDNRTRDWIERLLGEMSRENGHVKFEMIDPVRDIVRIRHLFEEFKTDPVGTILVKSGGRREVITERDLVEMDYSPVMQGRPPRLAGFNGEKALISAILSVAKEKKDMVFFASGHGEKRIEDVEPGRGLSQIRDVLVSQGFQVKQDLLFNLDNEKKDLLPIVVIFPGPKKALLENEEKMVESLLAKGVGIIFLLDPGVSAGLRDWLMKKYGVRIGDDVIVDPAMSVMSPINLVVNFFALHPITKPFVGNAMILFPGACSVDEVKKEAKDKKGEKGEGEDKGKKEKERKRKGKTGVKGTDGKGRIYKLIFSSPGSWAERDWRSGKFSFDKGKDSRGPVCVGVAWEGRKGSRMVILGDSDFIADGVVKQLSNEDFFLAILDWLRSKEVKVDLGPQEIKTVRLSMPIREVRLLAIFTLVGLPLVILFIGLILVWLRRRNA